MSIINTTTTIQDEFNTHTCEAQCINDCDDIDDARFDTIDEWVDMRLDSLDIDDMYTWGELPV